MFDVLDGCNFGVCYCCWNRMIGLATVISVEDVQSDLWQSDQAVIQNCCGCVQHLECSMFDRCWTLFAQLLQSAFPFYCWNSNNIRLVFLCMTFPIFIFVMLGVGKRRVKIPWDVSVVSPLFQPDYCFWFENELKSLRICVAKWLLIVHNVFNCCRYWLHVTPGNCCLPSCWSAGSGF